jgi:rare lipoprotein A
MRPLAKLHPGLFFASPAWRASILGLACLVASPVPAAAKGFESSWNEVGVASWYGGKFAGRPTASGETYDPRNLTAAHKTLPMGSLVRVHNLRNDRRMIVRINDRGPFVRGRVIDVSEAAAEVLGFKKGGTVNVRITPVAAPPGRALPREWTQSQAAIRAAASGEVAVAAAGAAPPRAAAASTATATTAPAVVVAAADATARAGVFVQLGAYRDARRANERVHRAAGLGMALFVEYAGGVYRVLAGPFESGAAAERAVADCSRNGMQAFVRKN